jgi:hypothetical protein
MVYIKSERQCCITDSKLAIGSTTNIKDRNKKCRETTQMKLMIYILWIYWFPISGYIRQILHYSLSILRRIQEIGGNCGSISEAPSQPILPNHPTYGPVSGGSVGSFKVGKEKMSSHKTTFVHRINLCPRKNFKLLSSPKDGESNQKKEDIHEQNQETKFSPTNFILYNFE